MEQKIISASLYAREAFETLVSRDIQQYLSDPGQIIWDEVKEYYTKDPEAPTVDVDILQERIKKKFPKHFDMLNLYVVKEYVSIPNLVEQVTALQSEALRSEIAAAATMDDPKLSDLFERFNDLKKPVKQTTNLTVADLPNLITAEGDKIAVLPRALNALLGSGVSRKHHIMVFGLGEIGKSLFVINMAYGFVKQGLRVGFMDNEDNPEDVLKRYVTRASGLTLLEVDNQVEEAVEKAKQLKGELVFKELAPGTPHEIRKWTRENKPDVLICNQIRNLRMPKVNGPEQQREAASSFMRNLGKEFNLTPVSITQASISAEDKLYLTTSDMDYSKVGCASQTDLLIGIGGSFDMIRANRRMLSVIRNKITGIHLPVAVSFDIQRVKVT